MAEQPQDPTRGFQLQQQAKQTQALVEGLFKKMELRKWAVEQAVRLITEDKARGATGEMFPPFYHAAPLERGGQIEVKAGGDLHALTDEDRYPTYGLAKVLTEYFHDFVAEPGGKMIAEAQAAAQG